MAAPIFDLASVVADLIRRAEELLASVRALGPDWEELAMTNQKYSRAVDRRNQVLRSTDRILSSTTNAPNERARSNLKLQRGLAELKVDLLSRQLDRQFTSIATINRPLESLLSDLKVFLSRLPTKSGLASLHGAISELPLVKAGRWTGAPPAYLELSLSKLLDGLRAMRPLFKERKQNRAEARKSLVESYFETPGRTVKQLCADAIVDRAEYHRWLRGEKSPSSIVSSRIERLLRQETATPDATGKRSKPAALVP